MLSVDTEKKRISLSIRQAVEDEFAFEEVEELESVAVDVEAVAEAEAAAEETAE